MGRTATLSLLFSCALVTWASTTASAQTWAVIRSGTGEATEAERAARIQLIDALVGSGITMRVDAEAAARVEDYHSVEPSYPLHERRPCGLIHAVPSTI